MRAILCVNAMKLLHEGLYIGSVLYVLANYPVGLRDLIAVQ